jgi:hypothetical protein
MRTARVAPGVDAKATVTMKTTVNRALAQRVPAICSLATGAAA